MISVSSATSFVKEVKYIFYFFALVLRRVSLIEELHFCVLVLARKTIERISLTCFHLSCQSVICCFSRSLNNSAGARLTSCFGIITRLIRLLTKSGHFFFKFFLKVQVKVGSKVFTFHTIHETSLHFIACLGFIFILNQFEVQIFLFVLASEDFLVSFF